MVRPAARTHLEVKVIYTPGKGKCSLNGKGVDREVESEGSRKQNASLPNRKRIEAALRNEQADICKAHLARNAVL